LQLRASAIADDDPLTYVARTRLCEVDMSAHRAPIRAQRAQLTAARADVALCDAADLGRPRVGLYSSTLIAAVLAGGKAPAALLTAASLAAELLPGVPISVRPARSSH
jgi:hypothetical protein